MSCYNQRMSPTALLKKFTALSKKSKLLIVLFLILLVFTRFYNLAGTARFTQDESSDLARMHDYWVNQKISLVGPISNDGTKVFSSLGYYMIMPFAAAFDFTPVAPVYGMAFLGAVTAIMLLMLVWAINKKLLFLAGSLIIVWHPLVLMSRWAWNPHFVVFWLVLALLVYQYRVRFGIISYLITGIALGTAFHHHYVAIFTTAPFLVLISLPYLRQKQYKPVVLLLLGYTLPHLAFVLFDLKNQPGLFFGRYLLSGNTPHVVPSFSLAMILSHLQRNTSVYLATFVPNIVLQLIFGLSSLWLLVAELKKHTLRTLTWVIPATVIIFAGVILDDFQDRYVYSSLIFLLAWLFLPRKDKRNRLLAKISLTALLIGSLFTLKPQLTVTQSPPDMRIVTEASEIIINTISSKGVRNPNIAALASKDSAPLAERYRDYIGMRGISLRAASEYDVSEHLFVVSAATDEVLRNSPDHAMEAFADKELKGIFPIENTEWKVFWYGVESITE